MDFFYVLNLISFLSPVKYLFNYYCITSNALRVASSYVSLPEESVHKSGIRSHRPLTSAYQPARPRREFAIRHKDHQVLFSN
jgi:hypothetical protein